MSRLRQAEVVHRHAGLRQEPRHRAPPIQMRAVGAPGGDGAVGGAGSLPDGAVVLGPHGIGGAAHRLRVGVAPGEDVGHGEATMAECPRPALAAFDGGIVLHLGGGRGVQHDEMHVPAAGVPDPGEQVAIAQAG